MLPRNIIMGLAVVIGVTGLAQAQVSPGDMNCDGTVDGLDTRGRRVCVGCGYQATVTAGTIFERTRTPLVLWFRVIWWVTSQKNGASALGLQRVCADR